jgi:cell division septation protein DedD
MTYEKTEALCSKRSALSAAVREANAAADSRGRRRRGGSTRDPSSLLHSLFVEEHRTHYQLSFTAKQALLLFVLLIGALGIAYFLGLMTGLSGRRGGAEQMALAGGTPTPTPEALEFPRAVRGVSPGKGAVRPAAPTVPAVTPSPGPPSSTSLANPGPTATPGLQMFDDGPPAARVTAVPAPAAPRAKVPAPRAAEPAASAFWVQALSANSEKEAHAKRDRLAAHGFPSTVVPGPGPHGRVYRVRVGPFPNREEAQKAASRLKAREKLEPWIVPPGK